MRFHRSNGHVVRRAVRDSNPAFVVDLCRSHVSVTEEVLNLSNIDPEPKQQRGRRRPQRVRRGFAPGR